MWHRSVISSVCLLCLLACDLASGGGLRSRFHPHALYTNSLLQPELYLTPYITSGRVEEGRNMSRVTLHGAGVESYSGYLTVNETHGSNMFFWFFPAKENPGEAPVILWLQGGPGGSSMFGLFVEHGPFSVDADMNLVPRNLSWNNKINVLYIDNPVGTGFSFTESTEGYAKNQDDVARDLYSALVQFFTLFDSYRSNEFYATGESYAGKYVPAISYKIHLENPSAKTKINFKGMAIGDGLVDPVNMLDYGTILYNIGLVDDKQKGLMDAKMKEVESLCHQGDFVSAFHSWDVVLNGDKTPYPTFYKNFTGYDNYFNYLYPVDPFEAVPYDRFLNLDSSRSAIHVGSRPFNDGQEVEQHLLADIMNSSRPLVSAILDAKYQVLVYSGQLDVIVGYRLTEQWLATMPWHGDRQYADASRYIWQVQGEIAGYLRIVENLHEVMVRDAGHMLPSDQPAWAYALINLFVHQQSLI